MRWVKEGDSNSRYFYETIKSRRRRRNQLVALKDGEHWIQGVEEIKGFVKNYFENNFKERWEDRPNLNGIQFQSLSEEDNMLLMAPFTVEEVREAIWCSDGNKCPGSDGFNFNFLKACLEIIKGDVMDFLFEFYSNAILPKAITTSFLTLIPKKDHLQSLSDYRPICLISSLCNILSKVLAARLKKVLGKVISKSSMFVLMNGSPTEDFSVGKGLRQGDPLSPFLFLIVAEGLTGLMSKAVDNNIFHGYKVSNNIQFHTLQFAVTLLLRVKVIGITCGL
ncbi:hypothetical protein TSUD_194720 [Trifolium subterraneum]|uniref:Reverse transcriptase domain-containing protein n=1 Tax=Trifolium subterraneum TaxID=3900 RepID=A0A2Z6PTP1_TRISU|nr:hypothetical protein TSUD_194720 [Trifolium subterraneum]